MVAVSLNAHIHDQIPCTLQKSHTKVISLTDTSTIVYWTLITPILISPGYTVAANDSATNNLIIYDGATFFYIILYFTGHVVLADKRRKLRLLRRRYILIHLIFDSVSQSRHPYNAHQFWREISALSPPVKKIYHIPCFVPICNQIGGMKFNNHFWTENKARVATQFFLQVCRSAFYYHMN